MSCECMVQRPGIEINIKTTKQGSKAASIDPNSVYEITISNYRLQDVDYAIWSESEQDHVEFDNNGIELSSCAVSDRVNEGKPKGEDKYLIGIHPFNSNNNNKKNEDIEIKVRCSDVLKVKTKTEKAQSTISVIA